MNFTKQDYQSYLKVKNEIEEETGFKPLPPYEKPYNCELIGKRVLVRSRMAGVMYGTLENINGQHVSLSNARMLYRWRNENGGASLNDTVVDGLKDDAYSKLSKFNTKIELLEACSILEVSEKASRNLDTREAYTNLTE